MHYSTACGVFGRLVTCMRRVRALHGDTARRNVREARRTTGHRRWIRRTGFTTCWALCVILPFAAGLHTRAVLAQRRLLPAGQRRDARPAPPPLVRDVLTRLLTVTPVARLTTREGTAEVAAWSPDSRYLAIGYSAGTILLWDVTQRTLAVRVGHAHARFVGALTWSPDGRLLASAGADGKAIVWKVGPSHSLTRALVAPTRRFHIPAIAFSPGGDIFAVTNALHTVTLWDVSGGGASGGGRMGENVVRPRQTLHVTGHTTALTWAPDGRRLAVGTLEGRVILWQREGMNWRATTRPLGSIVWALAWTPTGSTLAAGCADGAVRLLIGANLHIARVLLAPFHRSPVMQVPDLGTDTHAKTGSVPRLVTGAIINTMAWSPSGALLGVTATGMPLRLWDPSSGAVVASYRAMWDQNAVAWRPDGTLAAVAADDGTVTLLRASEPPFLTDTVCHLGIAAWCAVLRTPLAPVGHSAVVPSFMGR